VMDKPSGAFSRCAAFLAGFAAGLMPGVTPEFIAVI
jgi:hypothetical protein